MEKDRITFNAIDFESATGLRTSACSVAIVRVEKAEIIDVWHTLIKPPNNYYTQRCIDIHGITPSMTFKSPTFNMVYPAIVNKINGLPIVAHNSQYDRSVFFACKEMIGNNDVLDLTEKWYCTYRLYKSVHGKNLKLNELCERYGIPLIHHNATSDAIGCAKLFINYLENHIPLKKE